MTKQKQCAYWFLTINPLSECYSNIHDIIEGLSQDNPLMEYSYIYHTHQEKDECDNINHIHLVLYFKSSVKRFTTICNIFVGAHVEMSNKQRYYRCIQYLIHKNDTSKFQYDRKDIISNISTPILDDILINNGYEFEYFDCTKLEDYLNDMLQANQVNIFYFIKRFGLDAIKPYFFIIKELIRDKYTLQRCLLSQNDEIFYN